jgi:hypothetical protein
MTTGLMSSARAQAGHGAWCSSSDFGRYLDGIYVSDGREVIDVEWVTSCPLRCLDVKKLSLVSS